MALLESLQLHCEWLEREVRLPLSPYAFPELALGSAALGGACVVALWFLPPAVVLPVALWVGLLGFFRDPERRAPAGENLVLAPADGRVVDVEEVVERDFLGCEAVRVGIFMSLFDVHVNRAPLSARVAYRDYRPGRFHNAMGPAAARENECVLLGLERADGVRVLVRQVAGVVARRVVCRAEVGAEVRRGERFGMVKFGSRLEVYLPASCGFRTTVAVGERVRAGESVVAELAEEERG